MRKPFFGAIIRGIDRHLETTLTETVLPAELSMRESLDARYYGAVIGVDLLVPMENGMAIDFSVSGAPLYLDADYEGQERNSISFSPGFKGPELNDSESRLAGLFRAQAGLSFPLFGHNLLRIGAQAGRH